MLVIAGLFAVASAEAAQVRVDLLSTGAGPFAFPRGSNLNDSVVTIGR